MMPGEAPINQGVAISKLNKYLDFHNLPSRMNKKGICRGLACVHTKFALEGREEDYYRILKKIAAMTEGAAVDKEVESFVLEVVASFQPQVFDKTKAQRHSIEALSINDIKLTSAFDFGMIGGNQEWVDILKKINLQTDEVMLIELVGHAIDVRSLGKEKYRIYDPNYSMGFKDVDREEGLVSELKNIAKSIGLKSENLGIGLQVVTHPEKPKRSFPDPAILYEQYLDPMAKYITSPGKSVDNLFFAITHDDTVAFDSILKKTRKIGEPLTVDLSKAASQAVTSNSVKVLQAILDLPESQKQTDPEILRKKQRDPEAFFKKHIDPEALFHMALTNGRKEVFDLLLKNDTCRDFFRNRQLNEKSAGVNINNAACGGNVELLKEIIDQYQKSGLVPAVVRGRQGLLRKGLTDNAIAEKILEKIPPGNDSIEEAITEGATRGISNTECVKYLFERLKTGKYEIQPGRMADYLLLAIKKNQHLMVECLIETIKTMPEDTRKQTLQSIEVNVPAVEQTELSILRMLKDNGVSFDGAADSAFEQKKQEPVSSVTSFFRAIAIAISKWIDSDAARFIHIEKYKELKNNMKEMRAATAVVPEADLTPKASKEDNLKALGSGDAVASKTSAARSQMQALRAEAAARKDEAAPEATATVVESPSATI